MNLLKLTWKNLIHRPLAMLLSLVLFALGVGLISLLFLLDNQLQQNFEKNLAGVDLVIGAKGSPLQMILSSMYHIDAPTGNIQIKDIRPFLNPKHPLIEAALPLSMGDSYKAFRIVGTSADILNWYELTIDKGDVWKYNFDVTLGAAVAAKLHLSVGDTFKSSHGFMDDEGLEHDDIPDFKVTGILKPSGTVIDQLILTTPQTYWFVHDHPGEAPTEKKVTVKEDEHDDHDEHDHSAHDEHVDHEDHDHSNNELVPMSLIKEDGEASITNLLLKFKGHNFQALNMQRSINENTDMQAATPAIEITRLFSLMDSGEKALRILAIVIILVSGLSIFISLFSSLKERKYELSLMRVMGAGKQKIFGLIIFEGLLLAVLGYLIGIILSHVGMEIIGSIMSSDYRYDFTGSVFLEKEIWLLGGAILIGLIASLIPAIQAANTDIADTLSKG